MSYINQSTILQSKNYNYRYKIYVVLNKNIYCNFELQIKVYIILYNNIKGNVHFIFFCNPQK